MQTAKKLEQTSWEFGLEQVEAVVTAIGIKGYIDAKAPEYVRPLLDAYARTTDQAPEYFIFSTVRIVNEIIERGIGRIPAKKMQCYGGNGEAWAKICIRAYLVHRCGEGDAEHGAEWSEMWRLIEQATSLLDPKEA